MKIEFIGSGAINQKALALLQGCRSFDITVAWAGRSQFASEVERFGNKMRRVVIGTHLYQTDPSVIRSLMKFGAKVKPPEGKLFHDILF